MPPPTYPAPYPSTLGYSFGIPTKETGLTLETYEQTDVADKYEQKDEFGQVIEAVFHNARSEIVMNGQTNAALASMLGNKLVVANLISTQVATGGATLVHQVHFALTRTANRTARVSATYYPLIPGP